MIGRDAAGFTLVEMMLCITIIGILVGLGTPIYTNFVQRNDLDIATQTLVQMFNRAETYSRAANYDSGWSVDIQSNTATLFKGSVFATRDTTKDETYSIPSSITVSSVADVVFAKLTGLPATTPTITLTSNTSDTRTITINVKGMVDY